MGRRYAMVLLTLSPEIHLKSSRTRRRFRRVLAANLEAALAAQAPGARLQVEWDRWRIEGGDEERVTRAAARTFGVQRALIVRPLPVESLGQLAESVAQLTRDRVAGQTFAVRVHRRGEHEWRSIDAEREIGTRLLAASAGVDLSDPQVEVSVRVAGQQAFLVARTVEGPSGLPLGTQGRVLVLLSGGFDSAVAAWMMMRRGTPVDFVHFTLDCAQGEHALAVAQELHRLWGYGSRPLAHLVDFQEAKEVLQAEVDPRLRQVVLKQLMMTAADRLAARHRILALVTGESVGQVSSQTLEHLAAIDRASTRSVLRPLAGFTKQEIIDRAKLVGTHDLSARAREVCDLSGGPVAVAARPNQLERAVAGLPEGLVDGLLEERHVVAVEDWRPGEALVPVVSEGPVGVPLVELNGLEKLPEDGPVAVSGRRAPHVASRLHGRGRAVWVVEQPRHRAVR
ncbi:MAG: tRNA sulfurtransferase [Acidimicrobiia bacterium]